MGRRALNVRFALFLNAILAVSVPVACTIERGDVRTPSGRSPEADSTNVRLVIEAAARAYESGDFAALDSLLDDSLTVFYGTRVSSGRVAYVDDLIASQVGTLEDRQVRLQGIAVKLARSTAWATYRFVRSGTRDGERIEERGVGTIVLQRHQNRWQIVHIHISAVPESDSG